MTEAAVVGKRQVQEVTIFHDVAKTLTSSLDLRFDPAGHEEEMAEYFRRIPGPGSWSVNNRVNCTSRWL